jgi:hypothetical protein
MERHRAVCWQRECAFVFQVLLKPTLTHGKGTDSGDYPIIREWGEAWAIPSQ